MAELWRELLIAFCLMLVIEGMLPFLYPQRWRCLVARLAEVDDGTIRVIGGVSMLLGILLLYLIR